MNGPVHVYKAQSCGGVDVPDLALLAEETLPDPDVRDAPELHDGKPLGLERCLRARFLPDATAVVDALEASLPGGTLDQILVLMLQRRAVCWTKTVGG